MPRTRLDDAALPLGQLTWTLAQLAALLQLSPRTLRRWTKTGRVKAMRTSTAATGGGRLLFRREEVARLLAVLEGRAAD